jgi:two-component sensor histidine kinase
MIRGGPPVINRFSDHHYPDGHVVRGLVTKMPLRDAHGTVIGTYGVGRDVTDLMEAEERIRALLAEKEILLREIHHRVKNDFGMIRSLLLLEAGQAANAEAAGALREAASRVGVMARTYDQMDIRGSASAVLVRPLIEELLRDAAESVAARVSIETAVDDAEVPPGAAVALGIVLNELVTNAVKYAFDESEHPTLTVRVHCCVEGRLNVRVADNGRGFDPAVTSGSQRGHGLTIVEALLRQHGGSLRLSNECGAVVEFSLSVE